MKKKFQPIFSSSKITEEQENILLDIYMSGGCRCHVRADTQPGAEPEIRKSRARRQPRNQLEKVFLDRGLLA